MLISTLLLLTLVACNNGTNDALTEEKNEDIKVDLFKTKEIKKPTIKIAKPRVFIPVFPGTNCEYDSARAFRNAGAEVSELVLNNMNKDLLNESIINIEKAIRQSQIVMIPGGFSAGDEPDGSGKFIANVFRNERIKDAVMDLLKNRDGLMLGICNKSH